MVQKEIIMTHHCWNGRGGARGLATHVMEETFELIRKDIEANKLGVYTLTFTKTADVKGIVHPSGIAGVGMT